VEKIQHPADRSRVWVADFIRPEQEAAIVKMLNEPTHAICNASNMDTGKTLQAAELVIRLGLTRVLYEGVKDTYAQWRDRLAAQSDGAVRLLRIDATKQGQLNYAAMLAGKDGHFFVGSQYLTAQDFEMVREYDEVGNLAWKRDKDGGLILKEAKEIGPQLLPIPLNKRRHLGTYKKMRPLDMVVFDEIHVVANRKSAGRLTLINLPTDWKLGMSGTWVGNKFENAWSITRWLWPDIIDGAFTRWMPEWCSREPVIGKSGRPVEGKFGPVQHITGEKNPGAYVSTLPCYIRIDGELDVPEPELVHVQLLPEQRVIYDSLVEDGVAWLNAHPDLEPLVESLPITKRTRLRQATLGVLSFAPDGSIQYALDCQSMKLHALRQVVDRPDWVGRPVAIYVASKRFAKVIVHRMNAAGYKAVEWSGDVPSARRDEIKAAFLRGEIPFLVSVIKAFSTGLDGFQAVCNRVVWVEEEDNNMINNQAIKRYYRSGDDAMLADFQHCKIVADDTLDVGVFERNVAETRVMHHTLKAA
jgi:hypothetical protein